MPDVNWQLFTALAAVAGAFWFLVRRGLKTLRAGKQSAARCGSCSSCTPQEDASTSPPATTFVPLEALTRRDEK